MSNRLVLVLRLVCYVLGALLIYELSRTVFKKNGGGISMAMVHTTSSAPAAKSHGTNATEIAEAKTDASLPPAIKEQVDKITQSEILGPVVRPLPMALLGIAGPDILLRAPNGQTGLLRAGEELGGVKLLQVGTNRVLIEQDGKKKELMIFSGFGSETLLPKEKDKTK